MPSSPVSTAAHPRYSRYRRRASGSPPSRQSSCRSRSASGSPWIRTRSKRRQRSIACCTRCGDIERRTMSRTDDTISGFGRRACAASSSGSNSNRSWVRPKGNCSVISTSGASARNSSSKLARPLGPEGVVERRAVEPAQLAQPLVARAHRRQLMEARAAEIEAAAARRPRPAARRSRSAARVRARTAARRIWPMPSRCCT